jgi:hypothetical protein
MSVTAPPPPAEDVQEHMEQEAEDEEIAEMDRAYGKMVGGVRGPPRSLKIQRNLIREGGKPVALPARPKAHYVVPKRPGVNNFLPSAYEKTEFGSDLTKVKDWESMQQYAARAHAYRKDVVDADDALRAQHRLVKANPMRNYDTGATAALVGLIGNKNVGVRHRPHLAAAPSAQFWLSQNLEKAKGNPKLLEYWRKWGVGTADLDENVDTPDNVIVYSDSKHGKIKAVDGYEIVPYAQKNATRSIRELYPEPKQLARLPIEFRNILKSYYKKYKTPEMQQANPIQDFVKERQKRSAYQIMGNAVRAMLEALDVAVWSRDREGEIEGPEDRRLYVSPRHYITLVQKLTSAFHQQFIKEYFNLAPNYDFTADEQNTKARRVQKDLAEVYGNVEADGNTTAYHYLAARLNMFSGKASQIAAATAEGQLGEFKITLSKAHDGTPKLTIYDASAGNVPGSVGKITDQDYPTEYEKVVAKARGGWIEGIGGEYVPQLYNPNTNLPNEATVKRRATRGEATAAWLEKRKNRRR